MSGLTVLFDLDGTLTDSRAGITACIRHALGRLDRPCPDDDALACYIGPPLRGTFSTLLGTTDLALIETALAHYRARYDEVGLFENRVYDGVPEMLHETARVASGMFVATAKPRHAAARIVTHFGLARHFTAVYGAERGGRFDAKVDLLAHLLETGVIRAETSVMVGDRGSDISAAKIRGIRSIGAGWGYGEARELADAGADLLCDRPAALAACLTRLVG
ncbi:MAG: HAD hydrolase-like protein [Candidatus Rokuibacteriota bacterium]